MGKYYVLVILAVFFVIFLILILKKNKSISEFEKDKMSIYTDKWIGKRKIQEDSTELIKFSKYEVLGLIADGMGGYHDGKLAGQFAVDRFVDLYLSSDFKIEDMIKKINREILSYSGNIGIENKVGTTFLAGEILYNRLNFFSVGDSSIFLFKKNKLERLNIHQEKRGYLTNYLGYRDFTTVEAGEMFLEKGDIVLMCSDGLDKFLTTEEIESIMRRYKNKSSKKITEILLEALKEKKSRKQDNVSIIVIK